MVANNDHAMAFPINFSSRAGNGFSLLSIEIAGLSMLILGPAAPVSFKPKAPLRVRRQHLVNQIGAEK